MFKPNHTKNFLKFIKSNNAIGLQNYISQNLKTGQVIADDLEFLDREHSFYQGAIERGIWFFQTFIELGWYEVIHLIFDITPYIPSAINLQCQKFKLRESIDRATAFHFYISKLKMSGVFNTTSNIKYININDIDYPFYSLDVYEQVINQRMNKHETFKREYAYTDYFEFIACYQSVLTTDKIKNIFEAIKPNSKKESIFFLKFPNIFFQEFALSTQNNFSKIYEGLLHYGDEKWIKSNYMRNVFEVYENTDEIPFKNYEHFKKIFAEKQANKTKNISYDKMTKKSIKKTYPFFHNPKKGVIVIEKGIQFININFLDVICTVTDCGDMISIYSSPNTYNIQEDDFEHKEDFEKIRNYIFNTLRGLDVDFPDFKKEVSLSIEHH